MKSNTGTDMSATAATQSGRAGTRLRVWLGGLVALGLLLTLALGACSAPPRPPLKVGLHFWIGYDPLVLARERGLVDPTQIKVVEFLTHAESLRNFRNGLLDALVMPLDQALQLADQGADLRIIAVLNQSSGASVVMASQQPVDPLDWRGRSVALEDTALGWLMLHRMLQAAGVAENEVKVAVLEASQHLAALQTGRVDAAVTYEPLASQMRKAGFVSVFDSRQMPGEIVDVLVVRAAVLQSRPSAVDALLRAWYAGLAALQADPAAAAATLAPAAELSADAYRQIQAGLRYFSPTESIAHLSGSPSPLQSGTERLLATLHDLRLLTRPVAWENLLDHVAASRVQDSGAQP